MKSQYRNIFFGRFLALYFHQVLDIETHTSHGEITVTFV